MKSVAKLHQNQRRILKKLLELNGQKYSDLYRGFEEEDRFPYHLKQLLKKQLLSKRTDRYYLTRFGVWATEGFGQDLQDRRHKTPINIFVCKYKNKYLVNEVFSQDLRRESIYALPGIKALWGEEYDVVFDRELVHKWGCKGDVTYRSTVHLLERTSKGEVMFDDLLIVFDVVVQEILDTPKLARWLTSKQIEKLPHRWPLVDYLITYNQSRSFDILNIISDFNLEGPEL